MPLTGASTSDRALTLKPQPWRWNHPRVLVEHPDEKLGMEIASGLRYAGYAVGICPGPRGHERCPLTGPAGCAPAHDADLIVSSLGLEREPAREILAEMRRRYPETPLLVELPPDADAELRALLDGCHVLNAPVTPSRWCSRCGGSRETRWLSPRESPVRSPFASEQEAFRFVLVLIAAIVVIGLAVAFGPAWLAYVVVALIPAAVAARATQLRMRRLRGLELPIKMAPPHVGSPEERRVLVVANDTLGEESLHAEIKRLAATPHTRVLLLAPAQITGAARLTGAFAEPMDEARTRVRTALERIGQENVVSGEITEAPALEAVEDAFATFTPDEVIVATGWEQSPGSLEPQLSGLVRERFAVPVRHLVFAPGSEAREPSSDTEWRYRDESGDLAAKQFGLKALAAAALVAAVLMSSIALIHSSEKSEARAAARAATEQLAALPQVASTVSLKVIPEYKPGPEGEKHDAFTVTEFSLRAGKPQRLVIDNTDTVPHSITSAEAGVNIVVMPGTHTYTLDVKTPGKYLWFCHFICDEWAMEHVGYMSGYITVS